MIELNFHVEEIFQKIKYGQKTVETRALNPEEPERYFGNIQPGDTVICNSVKNGEKLVKKVKAVRIYREFEECLEKEDLKKVYGEPISKDDMRNIYYSFPGYKEKLADNGIVAIEFAN